MSLTVYSKVCEAAAFNTFEIDVILKRSVDLQCKQIRHNSICISKQSTNIYIYIYLHRCHQRWINLTYICLNLFYPKHSKQALYIHIWNMNLTPLFLPINEYYPSANLNTSSNQTHCKTHTRWTVRPLSSDFEIAYINSMNPKTHSSPSYLRRKFNLLNRIRLVFTQLTNIYISTKYEFTSDFLALMKYIYNSPSHQNIIWLDIYVVRLYICIMLHICQ